MKSPCRALFEWNGAEWLNAVSEKLLSHSMHKIRPPSLPMMFKICYDIMDAPVGQILPIERRHMTSCSRCNFMNVQWQGTYIVFRNCFRKHSKLATTQAVSYLTSEVRRDPMHLMQCPSKQTKFHGNLKIRAMTMSSSDHAISYHIKC